MKMNSDDKFNEEIAFEISALVCWSDLISMIGVDLSAWAAVLAPSLLSDPPRVFNSSGRPGISSASSAMPSAPPPGSFGSSGDKAASTPGASAAAFAAAPAAVEDSTAAAASAAAALERELPDSVLKRPYGSLVSLRVAYLDD